MTSCARPWVKRTLFDSCKQFLALLVAAVLLPGCSWLYDDEGYFRDRGHDYLKARDHKRIPQDELPTYNALPIPEIPESSLPERFEPPKPEPLMADQDRNAVRIQSLGDQRWLLVPLPPEQAWPRVRYFLENNKINVDDEDVNRGLVETAWLAEDDSKLKEKYRIRIDQGVQRNTAEVYVQQYQQDIRLTDPVSWTFQGSVNPEREAWMIELLAQYLANISDKASVSLMAQGISNASRVSLQRSGAEELYIELDLPFDRAWASVGQALKKTGMTLDDINRESGVFYVHREVEKEDQPFFLFRWFGASTTEERHYKFELQQKNGLVHIRLLDAEEFSASEREEVLVLVKNYLS